MRISRVIDWQVIANLSAAAASLGRRSQSRWCAILCLTMMAGSAFGAQSSPSPSPEPAPNEPILRVQLFLDGSNFKPGAIDGRWGDFTGKALRRYLQSLGKKAPSLGKNPPTQFDLPVDQSKPLLIPYQFSPNDQQWIGPMPESHAAQAKLDRLPYANFLELVGEKFHCRREFLKQINPGYDWSKAKVGDSVQVPNVAAPFDVQAAVELKKQTEAAEKTNSVPTEDQKPPNEQISISVSVAQKVLELHQNGKLVGSYPITPGSKTLPAPIGNWFVRGFVWMPTFRWDNAMLFHDERSSHFYKLPPGPNNPVGILWMELNHKGSGIHGTEAPETIGRTTSHGCIRLSNWDVFDLGHKVLPGVHVSIR